jgi:hypothetical protein
MKTTTIHVAEDSMPPFRIGRRDATTPQSYPTRSLKLAARRPPTHDPYVEHVAIALYIAIVLGGSWIAVFALLLYRRDRNPAHYYLGLVLGTAMVLLLLDVLSAYLPATGLDPPLWLRVVAEAAHAVAELVHFYSMVRLAYAIVRLAVPRAIGVLQTALVVAYAALIGYLGVSRSPFDAEHIALGIAHLAAVIIVVHHRRRIAPNLWRVLVRFAVVMAVCAPLVGISVYSGIATHLPLVAMAFQVSYAVIVIVMLNWQRKATRTRRSPRCSTSLRIRSRITSITSIRSLAYETGWNFETRLSASFDTKMRHSSHARTRAWV